MKSMVVISAGVILRGPLLEGGGRTVSREDLEGAVFLPDEFLDRSLAVCGNLPNARAWLNSPSPGLGGRTPLDAAVDGDWAAVYRELALRASGQPAAPQSTGPNLAPPPGDEAKEAATLIHDRLIALDPEYGRHRETAVLTMVLPADLAQTVEVLKHRFRVPRPALFNAAARLWIRRFEEAYGRPIPLEPARLTWLPPAAADDIRQWSYDFEDSIRYSPTRNVSTVISAESNRKLSNAVHLLHISGFRTGKRILVGWASAELVGDIVESVGPICPEP